jgi:hypothetical protein
LLGEERESIRKGLGLQNSNNERIMVKTKKYG